MDGGSLAHRVVRDFFAREPGSIRCIVRQFRRLQQNVIFFFLMLILMLLVLMIDIFDVILKTDLKSFCLGLNLKIIHKYMLMFEPKINIKNLLRFKVQNKH